jgi:hypothetical protein
MTGRPAPSATILVILLELASVGIMVLIAGASNDVANVMLIILFSAWFIYLIKDANAFEGLVVAFEQLVQNPTDLKNQITNLQ